ncbi:MAG: YesL family protein [Enterococcus sp.]|nr:YesL family protein [Enterococcus sp.]
MTIEKISKINDYMTTILTIAYLSFLWGCFTLLGLGIFGAGPATYAMMAYYDQWLRLGEQPPVAQTFFASFKARFRQSLLISWFVMAALGIVIVNLFTLSEWYYQVANVLVLVIVLFATSHVYTVMAATTFKTMKEILRGSALLGLGYLHYSILAWTVIVTGYILASKVSLAILLIWGVGFVGFVLGYAGKLILKEYTPTKVEHEAII